MTGRTSVAGRTSLAAPAPAWQRIAAQARYETSTALRNGEQLVVTVVLPLLALIAIHVTGVLGTPERSSVDVAMPGILALAVVSSAFTAVAISTGFERRYDVLAALSTTPLGISGLLAGKSASVAVVVSVQAVVLGGAGLLLGWRPELTGVLPALLALVLGTVCFTALGLLLAGTARPEATLAVANLLWVLFGAAGGTVFPGSHPVIGFLPSGALGDALRAALLEGTVHGPALLVLLGWSVVLWAAALRLFRWRP